MVLPQRSDGNKNGGRGECAVLEERERERERENAWMILINLEVEAASSTSTQLRQRCFTLEQQKIAAPSSSGWLDPVFPLLSNAGPYSVASLHSIYQF